MPSSIALNPETLSFGCVSIGFAYSFKFYITNVGTVLERFKVTLGDKPETEPESENKMKIVYSPQPLAPGMQTVIKVIFHAKENDRAHFPLCITRGSDKKVETFLLSALVVPSDNFKKISRNLKFKNKEIYSTGVECLGAISLTQSSFIGEGAPSMFSEQLISDEDFEDLQHIPFVRSVYYNPFTKALVHDPELSKFETGEGWSVEESQRRSQEKWDIRLLELETKGMVTERSIGPLLKERSIVSGDSIHENSSSN